MKSECACSQGRPTVERSSKTLSFYVAGSAFKHLDYSLLELL